MMTIQKSRSAAGDDMFDWNAILNLTQQRAARERGKKHDGELQPSTIIATVQTIPGLLYENAWNHLLYTMIWSI